MTGAANGAALPAGQGADLAGALVRRLAHDLAGPLAAAHLLAEEAADPLLQQSITRACDLLALYRAVFGGHPDDFVDTMALWQRLAAAIAPAALVADVAPAAPARRHKAAAALVLAAAGRQTVHVQLAADGAFCLRVAPPRPLPQPDDPAIAFAAQVAGRLDYHAPGLAGISAPPA